MSAPVLAERPALHIEGLAKTYPGGMALKGVGFAVRAGSVHGLVGGNGCGKSTLVKSIAGVQAADPGGVVSVNGRDTPSESLDPTWARTSGLRFVHQNPAVFPDLSVAENLAMGDGFPSTWGLVRGAELRARAQRLLDYFDIAATPSTKVGELRLADQTMVAIARALQDHLEGHAEIAALVLDEPTASLPRNEVATLLEAVRTVTRAGVAVIYISHRLDEVLDICDDITVLRDGSHVVTRPVKGVSENELVSLIVGRSLETVFPSAPPPQSDAPVVLSMRDVEAPAVQSVSFSVRSGEILGIAGLLGAGRSELLQCLFGLNPATSGTIMIDGVEAAIRRPRDAMDLGVAYIPEHRDTEAAFPDMSVRVNLSAADIGRFRRRGLLDARRERAAAIDSIGEYGIRTAGDRALMSSLSGGNQQKVVLARWMRRNPRLLLLDEPTQGVDVGARADAYTLIRAAVAEGAAAILVSSDFEELADMSDRVLILSGGRITNEVRGPQIDRHALTEMVFTAKEAEA